MEDTMKIIEEAIKARAPISFEYNKPGKVLGKRIGHPHALYFHESTGNMRVDIFQVDGVSETSQEIPGWRPFLIEFIVNVKLILEDAPFTIADGYRPNSPQYQKVIKKV